MSLGIDVTTSCTDHHPDLTHFKLRTLSLMLLRIAPEIMDTRK